MKIGEKAPYFEVEDVKGDKVKIEEGKKHILAFMRYIGCIWCQMDIIRLMKEKDKLKDVNVFVFTESPKDVVREYIKEFPDFPFRLIPDPEKRVYKLYGVGRGNFFDMFHPLTIYEIMKFLTKYIKSYRFVKGGINGDRYLRPAFFGVNEKGEVVFIQKGKVVADPIDIKGLIASLGIK